MAKLTTEEFIKGDGQVDEVNPESWTQLKGSLQNFDSR
jgi:hypothetical protein